MFVILRATPVIAQMTVCTLYLYNINSTVYAVEHMIFNLYINIPVSHI